MHARLRALLDLSVPMAREAVGLHDYDGTVQDLSPGAVAAGLARLEGRRIADAHEEAHLAAFEAEARVWLGDLQAHRWNPLLHVDNLDLAVYDRAYGPAEERADARRRHLRWWPDAVDAAIEALDRVPRPVAEGLLGTVRGLATGLDPADPDEAAALAAHRRLVAHVEAAVEHGEPDAAIGAPALTALLSAAEAMPVDLGRLAARADSEIARLTALLDDACQRLQPGEPMTQVVAALVRDHPDADGVLDEARAQTAESIEFTIRHDLVGGVDGECLVGPAPPSRQWAMAMLSPSAPFEADAPSWYHVTPPDPSWPADDREAWLAVFNRSQLPAITVHEVAPGHFVHFRVLRTVHSEVRRALQSNAFVEGWAHYAEELCLEEGFRDGDPRFQAGVALEALIRAVRLAASIGLHTGAMTLDDAISRFESVSFLTGSAARSEAVRGLFDPTYGRYTWGKLEVLALRDEARARWGRRYSHRRFHDALLSLGAPPLGLIDAIFADT